MRGTAGAARAALSGRALLLLAALRPAGAGRKSHYREGEEVPLYANKVGPYVNPSETYNYYDLPFCQHSAMEVPRQSLGETLKGDELTRSLFDVRFKGPPASPPPPAPACPVPPPAVAGPPPAASPRPPHPTR